MNAEITALDGTLQGVSHPLDELPVRLSQSAGGDLLVSTGAGEPDGHVAEIVQDGAYLVLRKLGDVEVTINGRPVEEAVVANRDLIQLGADGPRCVFRVRGRGTKTMSMVLRDSVSTARATRSRNTVTMALGVGREFVKEAVMNGTRAVRISLTAVIVVLVIGIGFLIHVLTKQSQQIDEQEQRLRQERERRAALEMQLESLSVKDEDFRKSLDKEREEAKKNKEENQARMEEAETKLVALEASASGVRNLIRNGKRAVAFIFTEVGWREPKTKAPLRIRQLYDGGPPMPRRDGNYAVTIDGKGPEVKQTFFGTGFLVSEDGLLLTNRHVADPWYGSERGEEFLKKGLEPVRKRLLVYFPGKEEGLPAQRLRVSEEADVGLLRVELGDLKIKPLPLAPPDEVSSGVDIVLLGYPAGVAGIAVKLPSKQQDKLAEMEGDPEYHEIIAELSRLGAISPTVTSGILGDVNRHKLEYDAATTSGGSGGPVCDGSGRVIGVNFAIFRGFRGQSFGVPIRYAHDLMAAEAKAIKEQK